MKKTLLVLALLGAGFSAHGDKPMWARAAADGISWLFRANDP